MKDALARMARPGMAGAREALGDALGGAAVRLCHPFEDLEGGGGWWKAGLGPLRAAVPDLERRETIRIEGVTPAGARWIGCCGAYVGQWEGPYLGMPPTRRYAHLRFHEFFRMEGGRCVEVQALWDLPELMMQAGVWPMAPSLGRELHVPGPATQDGLGPHGLGPDGDGAAALGTVKAMLEGLGRSREGVAAMGLERSWHSACTWYGPSGIGTARGISGFRAHHQGPFLAAMPDRVGDPAGGHLFAAGDYVGFTAWPGMRMTLTGGGWLGMPAAGQALTMRSLDFWRVRDGLIEENWVLVDLLDVYAQLGVDVLARMRTLAGGRELGWPEPWSSGSA